MEENQKVLELIEKLRETKHLEPEELKTLFHVQEPQLLEHLYKNARGVRQFHYGNQVYSRGLIEFTNYCKNNCYYCGIRRDNEKVERYRLYKDQIIDCADEGYELGFRTFVLQGGEDAYYTKERLGEIVRKIKKKHPDCAVTLSVGERSYEEYLYWHECGADRYLLRHETANERHYQRLHPAKMSLKHRKECLRQLREIGYQVGAGFMVGSPGQTMDHLVEELEFLKDFRPHMVGIGPFISQKDTPYANEKSGSLEMTLKLLAIIRLLLPKVLLPATTALGTIHPRGRELGILAGANVVMPNLSPTSVRKKYALYDNKICTGDESAQCRRCLEERIKSVGCELVIDRGDSLVEQ